MMLKDRLALIDSNQTVEEALREIRAKVGQGLAELEGMVIDRRERRALQVLAENIVGCRGVKDQLVCIDPMSGAVIGDPA